MYRDLGHIKLKHRVPLRALVRVASVAGGVQFGWALQLSLLTPYVQELGIPHRYASLIWLCGPISGMVVQPLVGHFSDQCTSSYGRRRPFIVVGAILVILSVVIIGFSADLGYLMGDSIYQETKPRAIVIFVVGFWLLDLANNTLQGPCRALLADYTGKDSRRTRRANAFFTLFIAVGNVLGFASGAYNNWRKWLPFTYTTACDVPCSNLKSAFLVGSVLLIITTYWSVTAATEIPWTPQTTSNAAAAAAMAAGRTRSRSFNNLVGLAVVATKPLAGQSAYEVSKAGGEAEDSDDENENENENRNGNNGTASEAEAASEVACCELFGALRDLPRFMWYILLVEALSWIAWFPFFLFDTDWMGREVYLGEPTDTTDKSSALALVYDAGVHMGSLGLMLNSVVLGLTSLMIDYMCRKLGPGRVWGLASFVMAACFASTAVITTYAKRVAGVSEEYSGPPTLVLLSSLGVFAILGVPLAVAYSVPYAMTSTFAESAGGGQGVAMGVLNLSVVIPQLIVSLLSGPLDSLLGGGNLPSFLLASVAALVAGITAFVLLQQPPPGFKPLGIKTNVVRRTRSAPGP